MMKRAYIAILCMLLLFLACLSACDSSSTVITPAFNENAFRQAWLAQSGTGMFFGTAPNMTSGNSQTSTALIMANPGPDGDFGTGGTLNVSGLDSQFPDNTMLWLKFTCPGPGGFGSPYITFRIEKIQNNTQQFVTEFTSPVNPQAAIVRLQMPAFSIGPGEYHISAYTNSQLRMTRHMAYLAPGQQRGPNFIGY